MFHIKCGKNGIDNINNHGIIVLKELSNRFQKIVFIKYIGDAMLEIKRGTNNEDLSTINRSLIVQHLKRNGISSRAEISKAIGLTQASVSKIMAVLIEYGIVKEVGFISGEKGRRSIGVSLIEDNYKVIGVKLSRRSFSVGVFDIDQLIKVKPFFKIVLKIFLDEPALLYKKGMANKPSTCRKLT
jgi:DNA-binding Lrp family transcriptional regulator